MIPSGTTKRYRHVNGTTPNGPLSLCPRSDCWISSSIVRFGLTASCSCNRNETYPGLSRLNNGSVFHDVFRILFNFLGWRMLRHSGHRP